MTSEYCQVQVESWKQITLSLFLRRESILMTWWRAALSILKVKSSNDHFIRGSGSKSRAYSWTIITEMAELVDDTNHRKPIFFWKFVIALTIKTQSKKLPKVLYRRSSSSLITERERWCEGESWLLNWAIIWSQWDHHPAMMIELSYKSKRRIPKYSLPVVLNRWSNNGVPLRWYDPDEENNWKDHWEYNGE